MLIATVLAGISLVVSFILANRRHNTPDQRNQNFDENSLPLASEGESICILFGTREIKKSNVIGVGIYYSETKEI